ncbi:hypothetical protein Cni_G09616 [Canna indica]|uniref:ER membrane protein complex subunit 10 n=1 Tax=Canna indica TaxID=4628 RepID=A0AAQ3K2U1_9LILI|nr:hypothetical protein Cni_G09616 [Canna indica]
MNRTGSLTIQTLIAIAFWFTWHSRNEQDHLVKQHSHNNLMMKILAFSSRIFNTRDPKGPNYSKTLMTTQIKWIPQRWILLKSIVMALGIICMQDLASLKYGSLMVRFKVRIKPAWPTAIRGQIEVMQLSKVSIAVLRTETREMAKGSRRARSLALFFLFTLHLISIAAGFQSDELLQDDEEFGLEGGRPAADPELSSLARPAIRRRPDLDLPSGSSDSKSIQFSLEHQLGSSGFLLAGTFTARLKSWSNGGQTLTKLRFSRNTLTEEEKGAFERLLKEDGYYTIRVPSNVLNPPGKDYVISSVRARCIPRESLDEHFTIHTDGVNILAVNYGSAGACHYPRLLRIPAKWSFNSYTVLKNSEQAPRTPTFAEELLAVDVGTEGVQPPERSFWAKYWMYLIPLVFIVLNAVTQAMNMPEEQAAGQSAQGQQVAQRAPSANARRR